MIKKYVELLEEVKNKKPLVHHITNYVTVNDCANITLAIGGSPIMADAIEEVEDIVNIASALVINIGTLNSRTIDSMIAAGKAANARKIPIILDPVGAGASGLRNQAAEKLLSQVKFAVIRGNISEISFLCGLESETQGVDASQKDQQRNGKELAKGLAQKHSCVVAITGAVDIISDGSNIITVGNGHPALSQITGTGCMCTSLIGSFCGASPATPLESTAAALLSMSIAGEMAFEKVGNMGNESLRMAVLDMVSKLHSETLTRRAKLNEEV